MTGGRPETGLSPQPASASIPLRASSTTNSGWPWVSSNRVEPSAGSSVLPATCAASSSVSLSDSPPSSMSGRSVPSRRSRTRSPNWVLAVNASVRTAKQDQDRDGRFGPEQVMDPFEGLVVGPVRVVENEDGWRARSDGPRQRLEQSRALPSLRHRLWPRQPRVIRDELGQEAGELRLPGRLEAAQRPEEGPCPQPGRRGCICERTFGRVAAGVRGGDPLGARPADELLGETALANPRLAAEERHRRTPGAGAGERG